MIPEQKSESNKKNDEPRGIVERGRGSEEERERKRENK